MHYHSATDQANQSHAGLSTRPQRRWIGELAHAEHQAREGSGTSHNEELVLEHWVAQSETAWWVWFAPGDYVERDAGGGQKERVAGAHMETGGGRMPPDRQRWAWVWQEERRSVVRGQK